MANCILRNSKGLFTWAVATLASPIACTSYDDYSGPALGRLTNDGGGGRGGDGGSENASHSGGGGSGGSDASFDAVRDGSTADVLRDGSTADVAHDVLTDAKTEGAPRQPRDGSTADVAHDVLTDAKTEGAPRQPDADAPCGMTTVGPTTRVDFSCGGVLDDFDFMTPPNSDGHAQWLWAGYAAASDGRTSNGGFLLSTGDARSYAVGHEADGGTYPGPEQGTFAMYRPLEISNVSMSVWFRSDDNDYVLLVARYRDAFHYYYLQVNNSYSPNPGSWRLARVDGSGGALLAAGDLPGLDYFGGHRLGLTLNGNQISASLDGAQLGTGTYVDDGFEKGSVKTGRVGVEAILMSEVEFDDLTITELPPSAPADTGPG